MFTSDEKLDKLLTRSLLIGIVVGLGIATFYMTKLLLIGTGVLIFGGIIVLILFKGAQRKADRAEAEYRRRFEEVDDGVTGYITVRPEELEGAPWEVKKQEKRDKREKKELSESAKAAIAAVQAAKKEG
jgi:hypothetical protein